MSENSGPIIFIGIMACSFVVGFFTAQWWVPAFMSVFMGFH